MDPLDEKVILPLLVAGTIAVIIVAGITLRQIRLRFLFRKIARKHEELSLGVEQWFMIQPCFRCHEFSMLLLEISPNGRSVHYQCLHCKKKMHAPAGTPSALEIIDIWDELHRLANKYIGKLGQSPQVEETWQNLLQITFVAPTAPLPFEQTARTPIPEAIRSEVWRRDGGCCVQCDSKQNLQFDHIIPVALGGATSAANLQLLCQSCNSSKGKKI